MTKSPVTAAKASEPELPCKVCEAKSLLFCVEDFHKNCEEDHGKFLPLAGIPVYYHRCTACGLVFSSAFDEWSKQDFLEHIYNADYVQVDPDYVERRARHNAGAIIGLIRAAGNPRVLDYGGGNGTLARALREQGVQAESWDPMNADEVQPESSAFGMITAFEVFEHTPVPRETFAEATGFLKSDGVFLFSTLTVELNQRNPHHWYVAPRNGHISIHTRASLEKLASVAGFKLFHFDDLTHLAFRERPNWLRG